MIVLNETVSVFATGNNWNNLPFLIGSIAIIAVGALRTFINMKKDKARRDRAGNSVARQAPLTPENVTDKLFNPTKFREGYDQDEVEGFLDEVVVELRRLGEEESELRLARSQGVLPTESSPIITPENVVNKRFQLSKFREGYDQDEVDDFLDEIVVELRRLTLKNSETRAAVAKAITETS